MNLVTQLVSNDTFIEGMHKEQVADILSQRHPSIRISTMRHGNIILSNNKIIKCIAQYYCKTDGKVFKKSKTSNLCHLYQQEADVQCAPYSCLACHLQCLQKLKEGKLSIKS